MRSHSATDSAGRLSGISGRETPMRFPRLERRLRRLAYGIGRGPRSPTARRLPLRAGWCCFSSRLLPCVFFPSSHGDIDVARLDLHRVAGASLALAGDEGGARAEE